MFSQTTRIGFLSSLLFVAVLAVPLPSLAADAAATVRVITFPTDASATNFSDDYGDPRSGGRTHEGVDILGKKMLPLYAAVDGTVSVQIPEATWGCRIQIVDSEGWHYLYYHVNNDSVGADDDIGCGSNSYAPGISNGVQVKAGQLVGYMGDSGDAEDVTPHLHFEIREPSPQQHCDWQNGDSCDFTYTEPTPIDPYPSLVAALYPGSFDKTIASSESPDINTDHSLIAPTDGTIAPCTSGSLIKSASSTAVYFCGANGKRYVFPSDKVYFTWYADFKTVKTITNEQLANIPLGGLVTYRPGIKMVKIESLPNVYAVTRGGVLRWIKTPAIAAAIYGTNWKKLVDDVSDAFFGSYTFGPDITSIGKK